MASLLFALPHVENCSNSFSIYVFENYEANYLLQISVGPQNCDLYHSDNLGVHNYVTWTILAFMHPQLSQACTNSYLESILVGPLSTIDVARTLFF